MTRAQISWLQVCVICIRDVITIAQDVARVRTARMSDGAAAVMHVRLSCRDICICACAARAGLGVTSGHMKDNGGIQGVSYPEIQGGSPPDPIRNLEANCNFFSCCCSH